MKRLILLLLACLLFASCTPLGKAQFQVASPSERLDIFSNNPKTTMPQCIDSDDTTSNGDNTYYTAGFITTASDTTYDFCKENILVEYVCEFGHPKHETVACPHGCYNGACLIAPSAEPRGMPSTAPVVW